MRDPALGFIKCPKCLSVPDGGSGTSGTVVFARFFVRETASAGSAWLRCKSGVRHLPKTLLKTAVSACLKCLPLWGDRRAQGARPGGPGVHTAKARAIAPRAFGTEPHVREIIKRSTRASRYNYARAWVTQVAGPDGQRRPLRAPARARDDTNQQHQMPANESGESLDERDEVVRHHPSRNQRSRPTDSPEAVARTRHINRGRTLQ